MVWILEGACGAGKTTLMTAMCAHARSRELELHELGQRHTYGLIAGLEDLGELDPELNRVLLERVVNWVRRAPRLLAIDTLHITQSVRLSILKPEDLVDIDNMLVLLGARLVLVKASPAALRARVVEGRRGTPFRSYASKFGKDDAQLHAWLVDEQERMTAAVERSRMPLMVVDGEAPAAENAARVLADENWR